MQELKNQCAALFEPSIPPITDPMGLIIDVSSYHGVAAEHIKRLTSEFAEAITEPSFENLSPDVKKIVEAAYQLTHDELLSLAFATLRVCNQPVRGEAYSKTGVSAVNDMVYSFADRGMVYVGTRASLQNQRGDGETLYVHELPDKLKREIKDIVYVDQQILKLPSPGPVEPPQDLTLLQNALVRT